MGVSHTLVRPLGFIFSALIVLHLGFWIYIVLDTFYPLRRCIYYWIYIVFVVTVLLLIIPSIIYLAAAIRYFRKLTTPPVNVVGLVKSKGVDKKIKTFFLVIFISILSVLSVLMFLHFLFVIFVHIAARPKQTGTIEVESLGAEVKVVRDSDNVAHINAANAYDAAAAVGVVHATERLFQMDYNRRMASGTLSAAYGGRFLKVDKWFRSLGFRKQAEKEYAAMSASGNADVIEAKKILDAYTKGVNSVDRTKVLESLMIPGYFIDEWTQVDTLAIQKLFEWSLSHNYLNELLRYYLLIEKELSVQRISTLMPLYGDNDTVTVKLGDLRVLDPIVIDQNKAREENNLIYEQQYISQLQSKLISEKNSKRSFRRSAAAADADSTDPSTLFDLLKQWDPAFEEFGAGHQINTAFFVSSLFTSGGSPILGADSNMKLQTPSQWMLLSITQGTTASVVGASFVGIPGVLIGRTEQYSWAWSASLADCQDVYVIDGNGSSYDDHGSSQSYEEESITIDVRLGSSETFTVRSTVYGPVLNDIITVPGPRPLSLYWSALHTPIDTMFYGFWKMWHCADATKYFSDFADASGLITNPPLSILYVSGGNNISSSEELSTGYIHAGLVPLRAVNHTGLFPVEGNGFRDWTGFMSTQIRQQFPRNSMTHLIAANNRAVQKGFFETLTYDHGRKYRVSRVDKKIRSHSGTAINNDAVKKILQDGLSQLFVDHFQSVISNMSTSGFSEPAVEAHQALLQWTGDYSLDSPEALAFQNWMWELSKIFKSETGVDWYDIDAISAVFNSSGADDQACVAAGSSCAAFAAQAFSKSVENHGYGTSWAYRGVHESYYSHLLWNDWLSLDCACSRGAMIAGGPDSVLYGGPPIPQSNNAYPVRVGATYRQIVDFTKGNSKLGAQSSYIIPVGNSGNLLYDGQYDQYMGLWGDGLMLSMNMKQESMSIGAEQTLVRATA